jgi:hypothetical protein
MDTTNSTLISPPYSKTEFVSAADSQGWYFRKYGCSRGVDPTEIMRRYTFPDAPIPFGIPTDPSPPVKVCLTYQEARPFEHGDADGMAEAARNHPQFAFSPRGPAASQIDVESQLRRLDQPLTKMQAIIAEDAPLFWNTVQPPQPRGVRADVLNAGNPLSSIMRPGASECRDASDSLAVGSSGRRFNNTTRQDTQLYELPSHRRD